MSWNFSKWEIAFWIGFERLLTAIKTIPCRKTKFRGKSGKCSSTPTRRRQPGAWPCGQFASFCSRSFCFASRRCRNSALTARTRTRPSTGSRFSSSLGSRWNTSPAWPRLPGSGLSCVPSWTSSTSWPSCPTSSASGSVTRKRSARAPRCRRFSGSSDSCGWCESSSSLGTTEASKCSAWHSGPASANSCCWRSSWQWEWSFSPARFTTLRARISWASQKPFGGA